MDENVKEKIDPNNGKKIAIIVISIIQSLLVIYTIINIETIFQSQLQAMQQVANMYPEELRQRYLDVINIFEKNYLVFECVFLLVVNVVAMVIATLNKLGKVKTLFIIMFSILIFLSATDVLLILSIVELIVVCCIKKEPIKDKEIKEKKAPKLIPELKRKRTTKSEIILLIVLILLYFSDFILVYFLPKMSTIAIRAVTITYYIGLYVFAIICLKNVIKEDLKLLKNNFKSYMKFILAMYIITKITVVSVVIIKMIVTGTGTSTNQETLNQLPIALTAVLAVIWAPLVEETVFRVSLRRFIKNDMVFIIISAITFGAVHVLSEPTIIAALTNSIPYIFMGGCLAYTYKKTNNELCSIILHGIYNLIDVCLMMLLL